MVTNKYKAISIRVAKAVYGLGIWPKLEVKMFQGSMFMGVSNVAESKFMSCGQ
jgi:hypothetical protein